VAASHAAGGRECPHYTRQAGGSVHTTHGRRAGVSTLHTAGGQECPPHTSLLADFFAPVL
jgi:hypothetical protein